MASSRQSVCLLIAAAFASVSSTTFGADAWRLPIGESEPVLARNVDFLRGPLGEPAVHVPTNGCIRYAMPEDRGVESNGTVSVWFKQDWTPTGSALYLDRDKDFDGNWSRPLWKSVWLRTLLKCGNVELGGGIFGVVGAGQRAKPIVWRGQVFAGDWHNLTLTWSADGVLRGYFDGMLRREIRMKKGVVPMLGREVSLGCGQYEYGLGGTISRVEFFRTALDEKAVNDLVAQVQPLRTELLDWSAVVGEEKKVRFRTRNLKSGELAEYVRCVKPDRPGVFRLHENGRTFELIALDPVRPEPAPAMASAKLVCEYDCTRDDYPHEFWDECGSHVVTNGTLVYREMDEIRAGCGVMYRAKIRNPGRRHIMEIDYPDDAKREFSFAVHHHACGVLHCGSIDCAGVMTGVDYPLSGTMRTKRLVVWPDGEEVALMVYGYRSISGSRPPAVSRIRFFEDAAAQLPSAAGMDRRTVGHWDEDPTIDSVLTHMHSAAIRNADLESWRVRWERIVELMKWQGLNTWDIKVVSYDGDVTFMNATLGHFNNASLCDGRCPGWAELGADVLGRHGFGFYCRFNDRPKEWFSRLGGVESPDGLLFKKGDDGVKAKWQMNFLRPEVRAAYAAEIRACRDKFRVYPNFRGITMNEAWGVRFADISVGYDDYTMSEYAKDTGVRTTASSQEERQAFLTASARREQWLSWRCRKVAETLRELAAVLREKGDDRLELQYWIPASAAVNGMGSWLGADLPNAYREQGIDLAVLATVPGVRAVPCIRPDFFRNKDGNKNRNEPYFILSPEESELYNGKGLSAYAVFRHGNFEIHPSLTMKKSYWKWPIWCETALYARNQFSFFDYATPHPTSEWAAEHVAHLLAEYDVQDLWHGWWGVPESGEHDVFRRFYQSYTAIPRGRFDKLTGWTNDPIAIRTSSGKGWYAVNRLAFPVVLRARQADGTSLCRTFGPHEVFYSVSDWNGVAGSVKAEISSEARSYFAPIRKKLESIQSAGAGDAELTEVLSRMEKAEREGRWGEVRALHLTQTARNARMADPIIVSPRLDFATKEIVLRIFNFDDKPYAARFRIAKCPGKVLEAVEPAGRDVVVPSGGESEVRLGISGAKSIRHLGSQRFTIVAEHGKDATTYVYSFFSERCSKWTPLECEPNLSGARTLHSLLPEEMSDERTAARLRRLESKIGKGNRLSCRYSLMAEPDGKGLRFVAEADNPEFVPPKVPGQLWGGDSIQLYIDQQNLTQANAQPGYGDGVVILQLGLLHGKDPTVWMEHPASRKVSEAKISVKTIGDKMRYDVFIPSSVIPKVRIRPGECVGFAILVNDYSTDQEGTFSVSVRDRETPYRNPAAWHHFYFP